MIPIPSGVRVWIATGHTDMRRGFPSLALQVQEVLKHDPLGGHLFCFRGRRSDLIKVIWHDSQGACLFTKRLERERFIWPSAAGEAVTISPAQLSGSSVSKSPGAKLRMKTASVVPDCACTTAIKLSQSESAAYAGSEAAVSNAMIAA